MRVQQWRRAPWETDPLHWFTVPYLPLVAAALVLVNGLVVIGPAGQSAPRPLVQLLALALATLGIVAVHIMTRPHRRGLSRATLVLLSIAPSAALVLSAVGYLGPTFEIELWWAPLAAGLFLMSLSPYVSITTMAVLGFAQSAVAAVTTVILVVPEDARWPPFTLIASAMMPIFVGALGGIAIISSLTRGLERWSERPFVPVSDEGAMAITEAVDTLTTERIRVGRELVQRVVAAGFVAESDASEAAELADKLRRELTDDIDRTWLQRALVARAVTVIDPQRLADRLDLAQRTALRALLDALIIDDALAPGSARVELRETDCGTVAVALRILSSLPEGQRESFLSPYYVGLASTVQNLRWRTGPVTAVSFEVGGKGEPTLMPRATPARPPAAGTPGGPRR